MVYGAHDQNETAEKARHGGGGGRPSGKVRQGTTRSGCSELVELRSSIRTEHPLVVSSRGLPCAGSPCVVGLLPVVSVES